VSAQSLYFRDLREITRPKRENDSGNAIGIHSQFTTNKSKGQILSNWNRKNIFDAANEALRARDSWLGKSSLLILLALAAAGTAMAIPGVDFSSYEIEEAKSAIDKGDFDEAITMLEEIIFFEPEDADALNLLGFSLRSTDRNEEAMAMYDEALTIDPNHQGALEYQGELFLKMGDQPSAEANLEKLVKLCPDGCEALAVLETAVERFKDGIELSWIGPASAE